MTSCDVPLLEPAFVREMLELADGYDVAVMEIEGSDPLSAVYRREVLRYVEELLAKRALYGRRISSMRSGLAVSARIRSRRIQNCGRCGI